uniref:Uncharacterized protein LOC117359256 n=1 Tax=Geotrypetes seraphini TaxID=260995 RepID=A0A6P8QL45_GEOSA|nr:uncharacterized protein LOC117359256 [Geotrypetes seraphini]
MPSSKFHVSRWKRCVSSGGSSARGICGFSGSHGSILPHSNFSGAQEVSTISCSVLGQHFQFAALPFGLATAPRSFAKIMVVVATQLCLQGVLVHLYLDDWLIRAPSMEEGRWAVHQVVYLLEHLGWVINMKSHLKPTQEFEYLRVRSTRKRTDVYAGLQDIQVTECHSGPVAGSDTNGLAVPASPGFHGFDYRCDSMGQRATSSSSVVSSGSMEPPVEFAGCEAALVGDSTQQHAMVAESCNAGQRATSKGTGLGDPDNGFKPVQLGGSLQNCPSTRPLDGAGEQMVHQSPGTSSDQAGLIEISMVSPLEGSMGVF